MPNDGRQDSTPFVKQKINTYKIHISMKKRKMALALFAMLFAANSFAMPLSPRLSQEDQADEAEASSLKFIRYGNFDSWLIRHIKESGIIGGNTKTLYEIAPNATWNNNNPYKGSGGSPWATSNVLARVAGITKTNTTVYREARPGHGYCARLETHIEKCVVLGVVNIKVLAAGSIYLGHTQEPITSTSNPMSKLDAGIRFTQRPKALVFDYKVKLANSSSRIKQTGFGKASKVSGRDLADCILLLQKRWEDSKGNIYAHRIGTMVVRFSRSTSGWVNNARFTIHYGDISKQSYYRSYMGLLKSGSNMKYAKNSKGKIVPIHEVAWGSANDKPTHLLLQFDSSHGGAYVGSVGYTIWVDNVRLQY